MQHINEGLNAIHWTPSVMSTKASATILVRLANSFTSLKRPIWLVEAACLSTGLAAKEVQRMVDDRRCPDKSASFTSS